MHQEPLDPESGRSAENHSVEPSTKPSKSGRRSLQRAQLQSSLFFITQEQSSYEKHTKYVLSLTLQSSEDQLRRELKETQEHHEAEIGKTHLTHCWITSLLTLPLPAAVLTAQRNQGERTESLAKLQRKNQELQKHLEKACRQLQRTVREHKNTLQKMKGAACYSEPSAVGSLSSVLRHSPALETYYVWALSFVFSIFIWVFSHFMYFCSLY